jgi:hypothetical protein
LSATDSHFPALKKFFSNDAVVEIVGVIALLGWLNRWNQTLATTREPPSAAFAEEHLAAGGWGRHRRAEPAPSYEL